MIDAPALGDTGLVPSHPAPMRWRTFTIFQCPDKFGRFDMYNIFPMYIDIYIYTPTNHPTIPAQPHCSNTFVQCVLFDS